jgi:hypothetical protein
MLSGKNRPSQQLFKAFIVFYTSTALNSCCEGRFLPENLDDRYTFFSSAVDKV